MGGAKIRNVWPCFLLTSTHYNELESIKNYRKFGYLLGITHFDITVASASAGVDVDDHGQLYSPLKR